MGGVGGRIAFTRISPSNGLENADFMCIGRAWEATFCLIATSEGRGGWVGEKFAYILFGTECCRSAAVALCVGGVRSIARTG